MLKKTKQTKFSKLEQEMAAKVRFKAYLIHAAWGCFEVTVDSVDEWFSDLTSAKNRYEEIAKEYRQNAMSEAEMVESSPDLIWTSYEYFFSTLVCFPDVGLYQGLPDELSLARLYSRYKTYGGPGFDVDLRDTGVFIIDSTGATWGEDGEGGYFLDPRDHLGEIVESCLVSS